MPEQDVAGFLQAAGWADATLTTLAGDASSRSYSRLARTTGDATAVLMQAPPAPDDGCARFLAIARHLAGLGLSPPGIVAADPNAGLILLEDLGDAIFAQVIEANPARESELYERAIEWLVLLHRHPAHGNLPHPDARALADMTAPAADWYAGKGEARPGMARRMAEALGPALAETLGNAPRMVFVHRDFHAENLVDLPARGGPARIGVLDFQDAWAGHPAYDLVSLVEDARRDLSPDLSQHLVHYYSDLSGMDATALQQDLAVLGAQRNLRILGVFARLSRLYGKPRYIDMIPRVRAHLERDLSHPSLADLRRVVDEDLPKPTSEFLETLKTPCPTSHAP